MRLRHIRGAEETIAESPYVIQEPELIKAAGTSFLATITPSRSK